MQQALDALNTCIWDYDYDEESYKTFDEDLVNAAAAALKEALAEPEQEPVAWVSESESTKQFVEGRPRRVWWECNTGVGQPFYTAPQKYCPSENNEAYEKGFFDGMAEQMHSSEDCAVNAMAKPEQEPQMIQIKDGQLSYIKKPWVGLTDEQLSETYNDLYTKYTRDNVNIADFILIVRTIEAQLKELNL